MKHIALTFLLLSLPLQACALAGAPKWVRKGHIDCSLAPCPGVYSAVGRSTGVKNPSLRQNAAGANARAELAKVIAKKLRRMPSDAFRTLVIESTIGVEIVNRWVAKNGDEYALASLSAESFHKALEAQPALSAGEREALEKQAAVLFGK